MKRPEPRLRLQPGLRVTECENCDLFTLSGRGCPGCGKVYCGRCDATELSRQNSLGIRTTEELRQYADRIAKCNDCYLSEDVNGTHISNNQTE